MSLILTEAGRDAYAQSETTGVKLQATHLAVGDGGGATVAHTDTSEALVNETWRGELQNIEKTASGEVEFTGHVPITVGGWYIREVAIYADDTLLAVGGHPETWKPAPESPDKVELVIVGPVKFASTDNISLTVDTTKVLASQDHVETKIKEHNTSKDAHATLLGKYAKDVHNHLTDEITDLLPDSHQWNKSQRYAQTVLTITNKTVTWDCEAQPSATLLLTTDVTSMTVTNALPGGAYDLTIVQDEIGGHACATPASWCWPDGAAYEASTDRYAEDRIYLAPVTNPSNGKTAVLASVDYNYKAAS